MFSIKWPMNQINENLIKYLQSVPLDVREVMVKRGEWVSKPYLLHVKGASQRRSWLAHPPTFVCKRQLLVPHGGSLRQRSTF